MIKFKVDMPSVWINGWRPEFDMTELKDFSQEEREKLEVLIKPFYPAIATRLVAKHTDIIAVENPQWRELMDTMTGEATKDGQQRMKNMLELITSQALPTKEKLDTIAYNSDVIDETVEGWKGFVDSEDNMIECTRENKVALFVEGGYVTVGTAILKVATLYAAEKELKSAMDQRELEKNLRTSQGGQQSGQGK